MSGVFTRRSLQLHTAFRHAKLGALARGIRGILEHAESLLEFSPRFFPFVRVVKDLRALLLQFHAGINVFFSQRVHHLRQSGAGGLGFIG